MKETGDDSQDKHLPRHHDLNMELLHEVDQRGDGVDEQVDGNDEGGIMYNDPDIDVKWPFDENTELVLSNKDKVHGSFTEYKKERGIQ